MEPKHSGVQAKCSEIKLQYGSCQKELYQQLGVQFLLYRDLWIRRNPLLTTSFIFALSYPNLESPTTSACKISISRDKTKDWETKQRTGRQNQLRTDLHLHPDPFYSGGYIISPHSLAPPDRRAGMNNTEAMPHCQGCEHSRNGVLWVKRSSLKPLLQVRCTWLAAGSLGPLQPGNSHCKSAARGTFAPHVSIPQEQSHNSSTSCPGESSPMSTGWAGGAGIPPDPQQHLRHQQVQDPTLGDDLSIHTAQQHRGSPG